MEKQFVPYELALKLKELGFDEPCFGYYTELENLVIKENVKQHDCCEGKYIAPLFQQAFDWFRETCELICVIDYYDKFMWTYDILNIKGNTQGGNNKENYNTYEEARLECLKKLIEIAKNDTK